MIIPHPESDLTQNTIVLGGGIIELLKQSRGKMLVDELLVKFLKKSINRTPDQFMESLLFLYSVGIIEKEQFKVCLKKI